MSDSKSRLPAKPSLPQLRKQAKDLLHLYRTGDATALDRFRAVSPRLADSPTLSDAQLVLAREYGFESWPKLVRHVETMNPPGLQHFETLASDLATAYMSGDRDAVRNINWTYGTSFLDDRDPAAMQRRLPEWAQSPDKRTDLAIAEARELVARTLGFRSWTALVASLVPAGASSARRTSLDNRALYHIEPEQNTIEVGPVAARHWDAIEEVIRARRITGVTASGITDGTLERLTNIEHLTRLVLSDSSQLTDAGLRHLARLPHLHDLSLDGPRMMITDRGLEVLRYLRELRRFSVAWAPRISDAAIAHLAPHEHLEQVNLMGTLTGDGAIAALAAKPKLRWFASGRLTTDAGLARLHEFPLFTKSHDGETQYDLMATEGGPTHLLIDGPFTDRGLAYLHGLDGLSGLNLFWHATGFSASGLQALAALPSLRLLGCHGARCDDEATRHIARLPNLRMLLAQGMVATDAGFSSLSHSPSLEYIWGRECPNLTGRGFVSLSSMVRLRGLAVSCRRVDEAALATLPRFPALRELMPMDVDDMGFRHVGRCERLERLWCMHCRDTTDAATEHISALKLKTYYAGQTKITDRSLRVLGRMRSLEKLEFWNCAGISDGGAAFLASLPRALRVTFDNCQQITAAVASLFPAHVRVRYSP